MRNIILLCLLSCNLGVIAQLDDKYAFRHIDQTDGLLHNTVRGLGQDEKGFIWILSYNGLQRYDGARFVSYPEIINQSSFTVFHDSELYMDTAKQQIWVTKGMTMEKLDLASQTMTTCQLSEVSDEDAFPKAILFRGENQDTYLIGESGMTVFEKNTSNILGSNFNINPGQYHRNTLVIRDPETGDLWTHNFNSFIITDRKTQTFQSSGDTLPTHPLLYGLWKQNATTNKIRYIMMDSYQNVWISTWTYKLHRYNLKTKEFFTYSLKDINSRQPGNQKGNKNLLINAMYEDRQKNLWIATDYLGLLLYNRERDDFNFITSNDKISNGLRYNFSIYTIFQDRDDNIWLGTDSGINIFNPYRNHFQSIRHEDGLEASLPKNDITDIIETAQGELWIATWGGGISVYDQQWHFLRNIYFNGPEEYNQVWSFALHEDGTIWAGTQNGYIHIYDPVKQTFSTIRPKETMQSTVRVMVKDDLGNIFLGLQNGRVIFWNKKEEIFYKADAIPGHQQMPNLGILNMHIDQVNRCWISTAAGLQEFDTQKLMPGAIYRPDSIDPVNGITVNGILDYTDSTLLIGTIYQGIYLFNTFSKTFSRPFKDGQLDHTSVHAMRNGPAGNIWMTTDYSLLKLDRNFIGFSRFNLDRSTINATFESNKFYELNDGRWVVTTPAELVCFNPKELGEDHTEHQVVEITGFNIFGQSMGIDTFIENQLAVPLRYNQNFISIEFSALDFIDIRETNYHYRLTGVDKNWIHTSSKYFVDYTDLKPGEYLFEVKADHGGQPSPVRSFSMNISPPLWGTLWFRTACLFALGSLFFYVWKKRIEAIQKEAGLQHQIAEAEMMALRSQMNPHFIFNCINSIDAMIQSNDKYRATMYLNKFAKLIRNVLDSSKQNIVPLSKDIETLQLYIDLELFRHQNKFLASIHVDDELIQGDYKVPPLIVQPYVENAILHGLRHSSVTDGKLSVTISKDEQHIIYIIEDNGVGRKMKTSNGDKGDKSYGMQISNDRVKLFNEEENASVQISDLEKEGKPSGTRIEVQIKIQ